MLEIINRNIPVDYQDDEHIGLEGNDRYHCTGLRLHVKNTGDIENFRLERDYMFDPKDNIYVLADRVGEPDDVEF